MELSLNQASSNDYFSLLKPRVMSLVIFTAICSLLMAPNKLHPVVSFWAILCIAIGAGAAGAFNMYYELELDKTMQRTRKRPLPQEKINPEEALAFAWILAGGSVIFLGLSNNWFAASLLAFTIFFYVCIYTRYLKQRTHYNIVIGGIAGALPPVIAWQCSASILDFRPWLMFLFIFLWTVPHSWALCLYAIDDYAKANIPMMPNTKGVKSTLNQIIYYVLALIMSTEFLIFYHSFWVLLVINIFNAAFLYYAIALKKKKIKSLQLFWFSIGYLFILFVVMVVDVLCDKGI